MTSPSFSVKFNGDIVNIETGYGQFYETGVGARRLLNEIREMKLFPKMFPVSLSQNKINGDISYTIFMQVNEIPHKVVLTYNRSHPDYQINVDIEHPRLSMTRMVGHWYSDGRPCYIHDWTRKWTALMAATQMRFWLGDYYDGYNFDYNRRYDPAEADRLFLESERIIREIKRRQSFWRFW